MATNTLRTNRKIDIIFCIDGTGSMSPCINMVKSNVRKFYMDFVDHMTAAGNDIDELNIKVITFRDYGCDGANAMVQSEWFDMTAGDDDRYQAHLNNIVADGGGDDPENGMEALFYAMTSDWNARGDKDRQVIVLFTDAEAKPIGAQKSPAGEPANMVDDNGLMETWYCKRPSFLSQGDFKLTERGKRLVIFAPAGTAYEKLCGTLNRSNFVPTAMDSGLVEINFENVIRIIAASASAV